MKPRYTRVSAYGLVTQTDGQGCDRILLCRISSALPRWVGQWTLPGGGLDFGESPDDAVVREVKEETGLVIKPQSVATVHSLYDDSQDTDFHGIRVIYHTALVGGSLRYEVNGTTDRCEWWTLKESRSLNLGDIARLGLDLAFK